jgi:hypothetical protein
MSDSTPDFWFPAKKIGWGWGPPVRWQGWLVVALYFALVFSGIAYFRVQRDVPGLAIFLVILTSVLVTLMFVKGERRAG